MSWNPNVPSDRRFNSTAMTAGRPVPRPTHVVCHVTGTTSFNSAKKTFLHDVSPHYLVGPDGKVYQFVQEQDQAWHAGIKKAAHPLYAHPAAEWRKYVWCFDWYSYPPNSVYLDRDLHPVQGKEMATFVAKPDRSEWNYYDYFVRRWGNSAGPVNYSANPSPNAYSVGIEILSVGAKSPSEKSYTKAMYKSLRDLVTDICSRNNIPQAQGHVVGHEDVNPIQRFGWDPNQGFDWSRVWA